MPSRRKGHRVERLEFPHTPGYGVHRRLWRPVASQRTKRQAMRAAKSWHQNGFEVRVLNPEGEVIWQR